MRLLKGWKQSGRTLLACFLAALLLSGVFAQAANPLPAANSAGSCTIEGAQDYILSDSGETGPRQEIIIQNGSLTITSKAYKPVIVKGDSSSAARLKTEQSVPIQGYFAWVVGEVSLKGATSISSGSPKVNGNEQDLTIWGGDAQLIGNAGGASGSFKSVTMEGGSVSVSDNNVIGTLTLNTSELTIRAGVNLTANGHSVTPVSKAVFKAWQTLPASSDGYSLLQGTWTLDGDAKVLRLGSNDEKDTNISVPAGKTLTVGDAASTEESATKFSAATEGAKAGNLVVNPNVTVTVATETMGSLTINGGTVVIPNDKTLTADKVIFNSGALTLGTNATLIDTDSGRVIKTGNSPLTLSAWGTLTADADGVELGGAWILPQGVKAGVASNSGKTAVVEGQGGELTVSGDGVYARGYFSSITTTKPLNVYSNDTICTETPLLSVSPAADATFATWGVLPGISGTEGYPQYNSLTGEWKAGGNIGVQSNGYACAGNHAHAPVIPVITSESNVTVYVSGASVEAGNEHVHIQTLEDAHITGDGTTEVTAMGRTYLKSNFKSVTGAGEIILEGETVIEEAIDNTGDGSPISITGNGQKLTVNAGNFQVKGEFASLTTAEGVSASLCGDVVIRGGDFAIADTNASQRTVTVTGGTGKIEGNFQQLNAQGSAKLEDSAKLTLTNKDDSCLNITGGEVTLNDKPSITLTGAQTATNAVSVANGKLKMWNGAVSAVGVDSRAVYVGAGGKFDMGNEDKAYIADTYQYGENPGEMPTLRVNGKNSMGVNVDTGGEAWIRAGEIVIEGEGGRGIDVSGTAHIYPNDQYGENPVKSKLLYVHGGHLTKAAMWIERGGTFDIRGRGAVLEEPPHDLNAEYYALYINKEALIPEGNFPLSGGTFHGKAYYDGKDLSELFAPNHYLRYDESELRFDATDGTYGALPYAKEEASPEYYGSYQNIHGTEPPDSTTQTALFQQFGNQSSYYVITDAEWELRERMRNGVSEESPDAGTYQIPAGIVKNNGNLIPDANVFYFSDSASPASSVWGMGRKQGDIEIDGAGHTLYLAGRTVSYDGKNRDGDALSGLYADAADYADGVTGFDHPDADAPEIPYRDDLHVLYIKPEAALILRDCVFNQNDDADEGGVDRDKPITEGGYIGTGTVAYDNDAEAEECRAIYNGGTLRVISAQITSVKTGVYTVADSVTEIGQTADENNALIGENNSNALIDIVGQTIGLSMEGGEATLYGGAVGEIEAPLSDDGSVTGIEIRDGDLTLCGGIVAGNYADGVGLYAKGGVTTIRGGCLYGYYADDDPDAVTRRSVKITGGSVVLNIDSAHGIDSDKDGEGYLTTTSADLKTDNAHHVENVEIQSGTLYIGADSDKTNKRECARINGTLTCTGGATHFYRGVVMGRTTVKGAESGSDFQTEFFVDGGHFSGLFLEGAQAYESFGTGTDASGSKLLDRVQIHGGIYRCISVEGLTQLPSVTVQDVLGHWDNDEDLDEDGANEWTRYNHYAERNVTVLRNVSGYYYEVASARVDDPERAPDDRIVGEEDSDTTAVVLRDALAEFKQWITADAETESDYSLAVNLRLSKICDARFHCSGNTASYEIGSGVHRLDMNNWGIFGSQKGPLMKYADTDASGNHFIVTNKAAASERHPATGETTERLMRNFYRLTDSQQAVAVAVMGGEFTLQDEADIETGGTVKLRATGTAVTVKKTAGIFTMNAGHLEGDVNGLDNDGTVTIEAHNSETAVKGRSDNGIINSETGKLAIKTQSGGVPADITGGTIGLQNEGEVTIEGTSDASVQIAGGTIGLQNDDGWTKALYAKIEGGESGSGETPEQIGVFISAGWLRAEKSEITGQHIGMKNQSDTENQDAQTVLLVGATVTGTTKAGFDNSKGAVFITENASVTGGAQGLLNSGGTVTMTDAYVTGQQEEGILTSSGLVEMSRTVVTGGPSRNGVKMTGDSAAKIHAATQINADSASAFAALYAETTGTVEIDGGSFARGAGNGVEHQAGTFTVTGGNLGNYALIGGELTVKNGEEDVKANFAGVTQSGGEAFLYGGAFMGTYAHTAGNVTVSVVAQGEQALSPTPPTFTWFKGANASGGGDVVLNAGRFLQNIENTSGMTFDLLGNGAIVVCDGSDAPETHDFDESAVIEKYILENFPKLETDSYQKDDAGNKVNLSAPFFITRPDIDKIEIETDKLKSSYIVGETLELDVNALKLYYRDGTTKNISLASSRITDEDGFEYQDGGQTPETAGQKTLTVSYGGQSAAFALTVVNRKLTSISLEKPPTLLEYLTTDTAIDRTGGQIRAEYDFGTYENPDETSMVLDLDADGVSVSQYADKASDAEFDNTSTGQRKIWIRYEEAYQAYEDAAQETLSAATPLTITVMSSEVSSIEITQAPETTSYVEYQVSELDMTGCELTLTYQNGTVKEHVTFESDANLRVEGFDTARVGKYTVYAVYQEAGAKAKRAPFEVTVTRRTLTGLKTGDFPAVSEYIEGKVTLDLSGGTLTASYDYAPESAIAMTTSQVVNNLDAVEPGTLALIFRYTENGVTLTTEGEDNPFSITVNPKQLTEIVLESGPVKTAYRYGEELNPAGGKIWLKYDNHTSELLDLTSDMLSGFDPWTSGTQSLTVTYQEKTASDAVSVTVGGKTLEGVRLDVPEERTVVEGMELNIDGWKLIPIYNAEPDGDPEGEPVAIQKAWISGYDKETAKPGNVTLTVSYTEGDRTSTAKCGVTVMAKSVLFPTLELTPPAKRGAENPYYEGDALNLDGGSLGVTYDNGDTETLSLTDARIAVSGFDSSASAFEGSSLVDGYDAPAVNQVISVTFDGNPCGEFEVTVIKKKVIAISVSKQPDKTEYGEGDSLNLSGGELNLVYNNLTTEENAPMTDARFYVSGFYADLPGEQTLTIGCEDSEASCALNVEVKAAYELTVSGMRYFIRVNAKNPLTRAYLILSCYEPDTGRFQSKRMTLLDLSEGNQEAPLDIPEGAENCYMELMLVDKLGISLCDAVSIPAA